MSLLTLIPGIKSVQHNLGNFYNIFSKLIKKIIQMGFTFISKVISMIYEDDNFLDSIKKISKKAENEINAKIEQHKAALAKQHALDYAAALECKNRLSQFAIEHKLDLALIDVWDDIRYYSSWLKREDFENHLNIFNLIEFEDEQNRNSKKITFNWQSHQLSISYHERSSWLPDESTQHGVFSLFEGEEQVFIVDAEIDDEYGFRDYQGRSIESFKKKGIWAEFLLHSWTVLQIRKGKCQANSKYYGLNRMKENFQE